MFLDEDIAPRAERLKHFEIDLDPMSESDKTTIKERLKLLGLRAEFDVDRI
jgi:hypothetical protein